MVIPEQAWKVRTYTVLPNPIRQIKMTKKKTTIKEFIGVNVRLLTFETHLEKGKPSSLANAKTCREVEAMKFVTLNTIRIIIKLVIAIAPLADPVSVMNRDKNV